MFIFYASTLKLLNSLRWFFYWRVYIIVCLWVDSISLLCVKTKLRSDGKNKVSQDYVLCWNTSIKWKIKLYLYWFYNNKIYILYIFIYILYIFQSGKTTSLVFLSCQAVFNLKTKNHLILNKPNIVFVLFCFFI